MAGKAWLFSDNETLLVAMRSGLVPAAVLAQPATYWRSSAGEIGVCPNKSIPRTAATALKEAGVGRAVPPDEVESVHLWSALLHAEVSVEDPSDKVALFVAEGETRLLELLSELVRLGCDRCSFQIVDGPEGQRLVLVRAYDPPYYSVALGGDPTSRYQVFVPALAGQEQLWIERGYQHPALLGLVSEHEGLELIGSKGQWRSLASAAWQDAFEIIDIQIPKPGVDFKPSQSEARLQVPLRFANANREESASLWVLPEGGIAVVESLLATMPDDVIDKLLFAVVHPDGDDKKSSVLLRTRLGRGTPPQLALSHEGFTPLMGIANLYLPLSASLEPPLRRDTLRELLAPDSDQVYWLSKSEQPGLQIDSVMEADFAPLSDWADYIIERSAETLHSWVRSSVFEFSSFHSIGREWSEAAPRKEKDKEPAPKKEPARKRAAPEASRPARATTVAVQTKKTVKGATAKAAPESEAAVQLAEVEREFLALSTPADDPERTQMWRTMAELHTQIGNLRDAPLCWTRVLWEASDDDFASVASLWLAAEAKLAKALGKHSVSTKQLRLAIATWVDAAATEKKLDSKLRARIQTLLEEQSSNLDVRSIWLARTAMARSSGGDRLLLARERDSLLRRLRNGLSIEKDVPTFLRFAGGSGADTVAVQQLRNNLEALWEHYQGCNRKRSVVEAPEEKTGALVGLEFAFGFATLGMLDRARSLRDACLKSLSTSDEIEHFLARAYSARVDQALDGLPRATPLPPTIAATLNALPKLDRYKVDRLRSVSTILEPQERLDPMQAFQRGGDSRGEEFSGLRGLDDPQELVLAIGPILDKAEAKSTSDEDRARLLDGVMDFFPSLTEADAVPALRRVLVSAATAAPARRALLLEEAMSLTGFFGRDEMTRDIASDLGSLVNELPADDAVRLASEFGSCLRGMRRVGLGEQASVLLERLSELSIGETPERIEARLHVAAGQAYVGDFEHARIALQSTQAALADLKLTSKDRLRLGRALAIAWSHAPREEATVGLLGLAGQLTLITDSFNTNSHFCLSVVSFMDAMVLALANGELAMGDLGRRWLDEDEYLIRRRIHKDLGAKR